LGIGLRECGMMVGERRFELPTSASRTLRANQTALLPVFMLYCKHQRPERCALTRYILDETYFSIKATLATCHPRNYSDDFHFSS
jgi:hypothetical protein